MSIKVTPDW